MTTKEKALDYFSRHFHCSQAVLAAYADKCGLTEEQALKMGGCLGSGMRKGEVCGACTGALIVLGALYGQYDETDLQSRELSNKVNDEMMERFAEKAGSYLCNDILGCDMSTEEGIRYARENNLFKDLCPKMVAGAVDVLEGANIGCHPCVCTSSLKMSTKDIIEKFLPSTGHDYRVVHLVGED